MQQRRLVLSVAAAVSAMSLAASSGASAAEYAPGQVIVKYRAGVTAPERLDLFDRIGVRRTLGAVAGVGASVVAVAGDPAQVAARLNRSALVEYAEPDYILRATATPNDPLFSMLYGLHNTGQSGGSADADIDAPEGWSLAGLGAFPAAGGAKVGIVDTGIQQGHPDLAGKTANCAGVRSFGGFLGLFPDPSIASGRCVDDHWHGTHVAGTVAAKANNGVGVAGVSFRSPLAVCKALDSTGTGTTAGVANCINWVHARGAKVISLSLGGAPSATLANAVANAWKGGAANGSVIVAAAGNSGGSTVEYPAGYAQVVSVAATDRHDRRAPFSTFNADVEVAAPGVDVVSTSRGGGYRFSSGTSMATPHAAGVAAIIRALHPAETAAQARARLDAAVDDLGPTGRDGSFGFGRVNLCKAAGGSCAYTGGG